jgi:hypothetical protein
MRHFFKSRQVSFVLLLFLLVIRTAFAAGKSGLTAHGELQFDAAAWHRDFETIDSSVSFSGTNMLTLNVKTPQLKTAKVEGLMDLYQVYGESADLLSSTMQSQIFEVFGGRAPVFVDLRMLYGALYLPWADITLGRQIVNYGKGMLFSPLDVFSAVNLFELSFKRSGSDIAMAAIPLGTVSGIDLVTEFPIGGSDYATAGRVFSTFSGWDLSAVGIYRHRSREIIGGVAVKGDLVAGVTGELVSSYDRARKRWLFEAMGGIDYSLLQNTWIFGAEYYYRSDGRFHYLYDRHNLFCSLQYVINDLMSVSAVFVGAFPEENMIATAQYAWNILQSVNVLLYLRWYNFEELGTMVPEGEAGTRVTISF